MDGVTSTSAMSLPTASLFPAPYSVSPLPPALRNGLWAPAICGLLSVASSATLLGFIISRFIGWRSHYKTYIGHNQYVVLIMNLLLADLQQGMSFLITFHWIADDAILAPTRACFAQGWLINIGDVASGLFVFFIAAHTFVCAVKGQRIKHSTFITLVVLTWIFALILTALGPILHGNTYFVRAGAWCWASTKYEQERLALHYIWIFMIEFGTVIIYALVLLHLRKTMSVIRPAAQQSSTYAKVDRATKLMVLYPFLYIILTLPLSAGRMWSMAHDGAGLPDAYACLAGSLIASSGWVDALLYTLTRKQIIKSSNPSDHTTSQSNTGKAGNGRWFRKSKSGDFAKANKFMSTNGERSQAHMSWSVPDGMITKTQTVTVVGRRASESTTIDPERLQEYEMTDRGDSTSGLTTNANTSLNTGKDRGRSLASGRMGLARGHSRSGSSEPIIPNYSQGLLSYANGRAQGYDGYKGHKTEVSVAVQPADVDRHGSASSPVSDYFGEADENDSITKSEKH